MSDGAPAPMAQSFAPASPTQTGLPTAQAILWLTLGLCALMAAAGLAWWGDTALAQWLRREGLAAAWPRHLMFVLDWTLMCVAMMLPSTWPVLVALQRAAQSRPAVGRLLLLCSLGFLAVWGAAGLALRALQLGGFAAMTELRWTSAQSAPVAAWLLVGGGAYLLAPIAQRCARACRSPVGFVARHWTGRPDLKWQALRIGIAHGVSCFGCCWPVMLGMCLLGLSDPLWMLAGAAVMSLQKQHAAGAWLTRALGLLSMAVGFALAAGWIDLRSAAPGWSPEAWAVCRTP